LEGILKISPFLRDIYGKILGKGRLMISQLCTWCVTSAKVIMFVQEVLYHLSCAPRMPLRMEQEFVFPHRLLVLLDIKLMISEEEDTLFPFIKI